MFWRWLFTLYVTVWVLHGTETFTVVTYNVETVSYTHLTLPTKA